MSGTTIGTVTKPARVIAAAIIAKNKMSRNFMNNHLLQR
jgi:hypothetical protein